MGGKRNASLLQVNQSIPYSTVPYPTSNSSLNAAGICGLLPRNISSELERVEILRGVYRGLRLFDSCLVQKHSTNERPGCWHVLLEPFSGFRQCLLSAYASIEAEASDVPKWLPLQVPRAKPRRGTSSMNSIPGWRRGNMIVLVLGLGLDDYDTTDSLMF